MDSLLLINYSPIFMTGIYMVFYWKKTTTYGSRNF